MNDPANKKLTSEDLFKYVMNLSLQEVHTISLGNYIHHAVQCHVGPLAVKELAKVSWPILVTLTIGKDIGIKMIINNLEMKDAVKSPKSKLTI